MVCASMHTRAGLLAEAVMKYHAIQLLSTVAGGGKRCQHPGCPKGAEGKTDYCISHGGGVRCSFEGCQKSARGRADFCIAHGGGIRCAVDDCRKSAQGSTPLCIAHGGGARCKIEHCNKVRQLVDNRLFNWHK